MLKIAKQPLTYSIYRSRAQCEAYRPLCAADNFADGIDTLLQDGPLDDFSTFKANSVLVWHVSHGY
jgi:hypothetical protein